MASAAAVSSHAFVPYQQRAAGVVGPIRHLEMVASPARCDRSELATPAAQALQSHRRSESANPLGAALAKVAAMEIPAKKEKAVGAVNYEELAWKLEHTSPLDIMDKSLEMFGGDTKIAFSGVEDVALIEYAWLTGWPFRDFSLKRPETDQFFDAVEKQYDIRIEYMFPDALDVQALIRNKGLFSFYEDGHQECCGVSKRALKGLKTLFTGQRKDQSPRTRANSSVVQVGPSLEGLCGGAPSMIKWNPVNVEGNDTWKFLRTMDVPANSLHSQGYVSIGCEPCTMPVLPGQHEREGRWWWNNAKAKECGLHKGNVIQNFFSVGTKGNGSISPNGDIGTPDIFDVKSISNLTRAGIKNLLKLENQKESGIT